MDRRDGASVKHANSATDDDAFKDAPELVIRPRKGWIAVDWKELLHYRELLFFLVWRDVKVRYKQTVFGVAWAILPPVFTMLVFSMIFSNVPALNPANVPYAIYSYAALLPFNFFSMGVSQAGQSLISQQQLLTKVYFPRLFVPLANVGSGLIDLSVSFCVFAVIMAICKTVPSWQIVFLPAFVFATALATAGLGLSLASLTVSYRDFRYVLPFMERAFLVISPVIWPLESVTNPTSRILLSLNPMTGIIDAFRSCIYGKPWNADSVAISCTMAVLLFLFGMFYFRRTERRFADIA